VTYNVFQARYLHSVLHDFATLASLHSADVILLQEALVGATRAAAAVDTVATLACALGIDPAANGLPYGTSQTAFMGSVERSQSRWGLGAVSRVPARFTLVPLPNAWWSPWPRAALFAEIGPWILVTVHLEVWPLGAGARRRQIQAVIDALLGVAGNSTRPVVLAGDFNCETGGAHQVMRRNGFEPVPTSVPTWSLGPLALRLDHVYVRNARVVASGVEQRAQGSDHRPLWVDVELPATPGRRS
jgi:endonuclease/exonuclease/phosphatase family metal-dependent hydrolase